MKLFTIIAMAGLAVSAAFGQTTTMVSTNLQGDLTGSKFTGRICVTPTLDARATAFSADGAAQVMPVRTCYPINAGVVNAVIPNTSLANPPIGLKAVILDAYGNQIFEYHDLLFTGAAPLDLDAYAPTQTAKVTSPEFSFSTSAPTGDCGSAAAEDYSGSVTNVTTYYCIAHQWVLQTGTGGGGVQADWNAVPPSLAAILNKPTLGTAAAHAATDFDVAGAAASALVSAKFYTDGKTVNSDAAGTAAAAIAALPVVARSGVYGDLTGKPTLGTASTHAATDFDVVGSASSAQTAAEGYTDTSITALALGTASKQSTSAFDPAGSAATAQTNSEGYTDTAVAPLGARVQSGINVVFDGDSLTAGTGTVSSTTRWPTVLLTYPEWSGRVANSYNVAISGQTCEQRVTAYSTSVHPHSPAVTGIPAYYFLWIGTNSISNGDSSATLYACIASLWTSANTDGFTVVASTMQAVSAEFANPTLVLIRQQVNQMIRSAGPSATTYSYLMDPDRMFADPHDTTWMQNDAIHPNAAGNAAFANYVNGLIWSHGNVAPMIGPSPETGTDLGTLALNFRDNKWSLYSISTGQFNSAFGWGSLAAMTAGSDNTAAGYQALIALTSGSNNSAFGYGAGNQATANNEAFFGSLTGHSVTTGPGNSFFGSGAGAGCTTCSESGAWGHSSALAAAVTKAYQIGVGTNSESNTLQYQTVKITGLPAAFSALPTCSSTNEGSKLPVTDSTTAVSGTTITGGGTNHVDGYCNGTNWLVGSGGAGAGGASGFPILLGSTSIASGSTTTALLGLTVDGVSPTTFSFLDATGSIQGQLNAKAATSSLAAVATSGSYTDLISKPTLGTAAAQNTTAFDAAGAATSAQAASLQKSSNLSDLASAPTARTNLGLGTAATQASTAFDAAGAASTAVTTAEAFSANAANLTSGTVSIARLTLPLSCQPGIGDGLNAIPAGTYLTTTCKNETGQTWTITAIRCLADAGSSTCTVTNGAGTSLLTGAITGTSTYANGTQSATTIIASGDYLKVAFVADGTTKQLGIDVAGTY
jgi:lysophospholipase L1-like esterase